MNTGRLLPAYSMSNHNNYQNFEGFDNKDDIKDFILDDFPILAIGRANISCSSFLIKLINDIYGELDAFFERLTEQFNHEIIRDILFAFDCFSKLLLKKQGK